MPRADPVPRVLIVEGVWGAGKTTYITRHLRSASPADTVWLNEPDHRGALAPSSGPADVWRWYFAAHTANLAAALSLVRRRDVNVYIERSPAAALAFGNVVLSMDSESLQPRIDATRELARCLRDACPLQLIYLPLVDVDRILAHMRSSPHLLSLAKPDIVRDLDHSLQNYVHMVFDPF